MPCCPFLLSGLRSILESNAVTRCRYNCCRRNSFPSRQRRTESDAESRCGDGRSRRAIPHCCDDGAAVIRKSGPEIKNRCTKDGVNRQNLASIPKSGPEIKNRCTQVGLNGENLAVIRKSGPEIKNHYTVEGVSRQNRQ